jgi:hypothetical protein
MNLKRSLVTLLVLFAPLAFLLKTGQVGFSERLLVTVSEKGVRQEQLIVWAGTHPGLVLWAVAALFLFGWLMFEKTPEGFWRPASLGRRVFAFILDILFAAFVLLPLSALVPLALEASESGRFSWQFNRSFHVPFDEWMWVVLALMAVLLLLYFVYPLAYGKPTVGSHLMDLATTLDDKPVPLGYWRALQRTGWEFVALCFFPFTLISGRDEEGRTWHDRRSGLQVRHFVQPEASGSATGAAAQPPARGIALVWYFMFVIFACGAAFWYNLAYPSGLSSFTQDETLSWRLYRYPDFGFALESPYPLRQKTMKPETGVARRLILAADIPEAGVLIEVRGIEYTQALPKEAPQQFAGFIPALFKADPAVKDFKCASRMGTCSGLPAVLLEGTYEMGGALCRFEAVGVVSGNRVWMVEIAVLDGPDMKYLADRVIKSLTLEGPGLPVTAR